MEKVRYIFPTEETTQVVPLASIGYVDSYIFEDAVPQLLNTTENVIAHLRLSLKECQQQGVSPDSLFLTLLKVCLDNRYKSVDLTPFLKDTIPFTLALIILGISFHEDKLNIDSIVILIRAVVALAMKEGVFKTQRSNKTSRAGEKDINVALRDRIMMAEGIDSVKLDSLLAMLSLLMSAAANIVKKPSFDATFDVSYFITLSCQSAAHPSIIHGATKLLEAAAEKPQLQERIVEQIVPKLSQLAANPHLCTAEDRGSIYASHSDTLLALVTIATLRGLKTASVGDANYLIPLTGRIVMSLVNLFGSSQILKAPPQTDDDEEDMDAWKRTFRKLVSKAQQSVPDAKKCAVRAGVVESVENLNNILAAQQLTISATRELPSLVSGLVVLGAIVNASVEKALGQAACLTYGALDGTGILTEPSTLAALEAIFLRFTGDSVMELPVVDILKVVLPGPTSTMRLKGVAVAACALSLWKTVVYAETNGMARAVLVKECRQNILKSIDTRHVAQIVAEYKEQSRLTKKDTLVSAVDYDESLDRVSARKCVGALFSLFGAELLFNIVPDCRINVLETDVVESSDFVIDSGIWLLECLTEHGGCEGLMEFDLWTKMIKPAIDNCSQHRSEAVAPLYAQVNYVLKSTLHSFLSRVIDNSDVAVDIIVKSLSDSTNSVQDILMLSNVLRRSMKDFVKQAAALPSVNTLTPVLLNIVERTWQGVFEWAQKVMVEGNKRCNGELVAAGRDLLATVCGVIPAQFLETLIALIIKQTMNLSVGDESYSVYVELLAIVIEENLQNVEMSIIDQLTVYSLNQIQEHVETSKAVSRAWHHVLIRLLEASNIKLAHSTTMPQHLEMVLQVVYQLREKIDITLWKTRMQVWEALLRELIRVRPSYPDPKVLIQYLIQGPLFESSLKAASLTSVTRRRSRRVLTKLVTLFNDLGAQKELLDFIMLGIATTEVVTMQRGFVNAATHLLAEDGGSIAGEKRLELETVLSMAKPLCFNLDKKSTHSSILGSQMTKSTRFTTASRRSVKSMFKPVRQ